MSIGVSPFRMIWMIGQLPHQIIASFLNNFPEFTCVFFIHANPNLDLSRNDLVYDLVSYKILFHCLKSKNPITKTKPIIKKVEVFTFFSFVSTSISFLRESNVSSSNISFDFVVLLSRLEFSS